MLKITFKESEYLFVGRELSHGGPIATIEDYEDGRCSYAHLCGDGKVRQFNRVIGSVDDIDIIGTCKPSVGAHSVVGLLTDESWPQNR